jgi:hypothetical protein
VCSLELENSIGLGILGIGISGSMKSNEVYVYGDLFNFLLQSDIGVGINISPLIIFSGINDINTFYLTFVNTSIFYNFLKNKNIILGPFISINGVRHNHHGSFEFHSGLMFLMRNMDFNNYYPTSGSLFGRDFLFAEVGYKYNNDNQGIFYAHLGIDILSALYLVGMGKKDDIDKYQKEHSLYQR